MHIECGKPAHRRLFCLALEYRTLVAMKKTSTLLALLLTCLQLSAQTANEIKDEAEQAVKLFTWDVEKYDKGSMMFLDVPYQRDGHDIEYLTLTVAMSKTKQRPDFISVIVPSNIVKENGIFIKFATSSETEGMVLDKEKPLRVNFENCTDETCTARIIDGYVKDESKTVDLLQRMKDLDHILFLFVYEDGSHKSVAVPLFSFKDQYKKLF